MSYVIGQVSGMGTDAQIRTGWTASSSFTNVVAPDQLTGMTANVSSWAWSIVEVTNTAGIDGRYWVRSATTSTLTLQNLDGSTPAFGAESGSFNTQRKYVVPTAMHAGTVYVAAYPATNQIQVSGTPFTDDAWAADMHVLIEMSTNNNGVYEIAQVINNKTLQIKSSNLVTTPGDGRLRLWPKSYEVRMIDETAPTLAAITSEAATAGLTDAITSYPTGAARVGQSPNKRYVFQHRVNIWLWDNSGGGQDGTWTIENEFVIARSRETPSGHLVCKGTPTYTVNVGRFGADNDSISAPSFLMGINNMGPPAADLFTTNVAGSVIVGTEAHAYTYTSFGGVSGRFVGSTMFDRKNLSAMNFLDDCVVRQATLPTTGSGAVNTVGNYEELEGIWFGRPAGGTYIQWIQTLTGLRKGGESAVPIYNLWGPAGPASAVLTVIDPYEQYLASDIARHFIPGFFGGFCYVKYRWTPTFKWERKSDSFTQVPIEGLHVKVESFGSDWSLVVAFDGVTDANGQINGGAPLELLSSALKPWAQTSVTYLTLISYWGQGVIPQYRSVLEQAELTRRSDCVYTVQPTRLDFEGDFTG